MIQALAVETALLIIFVITLICVGKVCHNLQKENKELEVELSKQTLIAQYLKDHIDGLQDIKTNGKEVAQAISEAKTDEEVINIINNLISSNNNKLRK